MQRKINFRAWIEQSNEGKPMMFYQNDQYLQSFLRRANFFSNTEGLEHDKYGNFQLLQFTGLKDKNGKEIYEGDIVKSARSWIWQVVFEKGSFKFLRNGIKPFLPSEVQIFNIEVIGNVWENPELIKQN